MQRRLAALVSLALVVPLGSTVAGSTAPAAEADVPPKAPYEATIERTRHGIPHVTADSWGDLGFGSGYAAAETSACTLADTLLTGRGERSRWFGPDKRYNDQVTLQASNLQVDAFVTDLRNREVVETLLADRENGPSPQARAMVRGYVAGVNDFLGTDSVTDPACAGAAYLDRKATALDVWYGVYLANLLASGGVFVKEIVDADPPSADDPGLPEVPVAAEVDRDALLTALGRDPEAPFGSNATAVGGDHTTTGRGMLLGNPHFPWRGRYRFTQQHLTIPGRYDVAGASLIGSPVVNIGFNDHVAWSHTVSTAYRFTPYEYPLASPLTPTTYLTGDGPAELERRTVEVTVRTPEGLEQREEDLYRTAEGYVVDSPATLMPWSVASVWAIRDANAEHLRTIDTFLDMGRATDVHDLLARQDAQGGMPWVNTTAADRSGEVVYADHSVVPNVPDEMAQQCLTASGRLLYELVGLPGLDGTRAGGACRWRTDEGSVRPGVFGPENLPELFTRDWAGNANDSYWTPNDTERLEGFAPIIGCEDCARTMRTRMVYRYVTDRIRGEEARPVSPRVLRGWEHRNRLMAAEVMREDGALDEVCDEAAEPEACGVLASWDGRSDKDSVGTHLFEAFVERLPAQGAWLTPFDAGDPLNTPRDLNTTNPQVRQAMTDAIDAVREAGVAFDAPWGRLQVAGDRGAPPIALGGGTGDAVGNANALASRWARANTDRYRPITYGSSHIQAVSFRDGGRVDARTILTYGQAESPRSPWSRDQTRLFSQERWVRFPWTDAQVRRDLVRRYVVSGR
jgi:acyl-homoserine-lactone acylase